MKLLCGLSKLKKMPHLLLLILLSGQVEMNPGPVDSQLSNSSFSESASCGICEHEVTNIGIYCDRCQTWFHQHCASVSDDTYYNILPRDSVSWICCLCGLPNHSTVSSLFANSNFESKNSFRALANDDDTDLSPDLDLSNLEKAIPSCTSTPKKVPTRKTHQHRNKKHKLKAIVINCDGLKGQKSQADFRAAVNNIDPDIIMGCESKIDSSIASYSVFPQNYNIIPKDRDKNGGGVFLAIKNSLIVSELPELDSNSEIVWANLHFANAKSIYLASYYRTPNAGPASLDMLEDLNVSLSSLFSKHPRQVPNLVIGGDFNLGDIDWETWTPTIQRTRPIHDKFLQLLMEHSLVQVNRHITRPASKKCLDYVVTSNQNLVSNIEVFPGVSDHLIVAFNIDMKPHHSVKPQRKIFVFKKANNDLLKEDVSRFSAEFLSSNPQENSVNENWLTIK